jgi:hypothetical protein
MRREWRAGLVAVATILVVSVMLAPSALAGRALVEDFHTTYYRNGEDVAWVSTTITIVGVEMTDDDMPVKITFMDPSDSSQWFARYELHDELKDRVIRTDGWGRPIWSYKNYTAEFGFETDATGMLDFRLMVSSKNRHEYNQLHSVLVDPGTDPAAEEPTFFQTLGLFSILSIIVVLAVILGVGAYSVKVVQGRRRELHSQSFGMDMEAEDTDTMVKCQEGEEFRRVPLGRGRRALSSSVVHSELDAEEPT